jgi:hypothetical protein
VEGGCRVDSPCSGQGPVAGPGKCSDEPGAMESVS